MDNLCICKKQIKNKNSKFLKNFVFLFLVELNVDDEKCLYPLDMENVRDDGT